MKQAKNQLILVEGLTGLGKSTMAHFLARQYQYNGFAASWVHEGEAPHPVSVDDRLDTTTFMNTALEQWSAFVSEIIESGRTVVIEASFFNNLIETLFTRGLDYAAILDFGLKLQQVVKPAEPALIYLVHPHISDALAKNFRNRGFQFQDFVLDYVANTPIAKEKGWHNYDGMVMFWQEFVSITDALFQAYKINKLDVDVSTGNWTQHHQQITAFLALSLVDDPAISATTAAKYTGTYRLEKTDHTCTVQYQNQVLATNLFMNVAAKLIPKHDHIFVVEGWHFELHFEFDDDTNAATSFTINGRDIDYLKAVGLKAIKVTA